MSQRIIAIDYIRGIAMLGVIAIHTGAYSLSNPAVNIHLFALLEICSRFSVPIFFFISAFGAFYQIYTHQFRFSPWRRLRSILIPYVIWSFLYMAYYTLIQQDSSIWQPAALFQYIFFGLASYQLYFLVILLWFIVLMPLWQYAVRWIMHRPVCYLSLLLLFQIGFNYYSSYYLSPNFSNPIINILIEHRMSYWVLHYVFIYLFGAVCAVSYEQCSGIVEQYKLQINLFLTVSLGGMLAAYYGALFYFNYSLEATVYTIHQLSPIGVVYTLAATLYLYRVFSQHQFSPTVQIILQALADHSFFIFLVHPFIMYALFAFLASYQIPMTSAVIAAFYIMTVGISLSIAKLFQQLTKKIPVVSIMTTGKTYHVPTN